MEEIWKDVLGFEEFYQVSSLGRVRGKDRLVRHSGTLERIQYGKLIKPRVNKRNGYVHVGLHKDGIAKSCKIHRLVALAFIDNIENKPEVNHLDENKSNNRVDNLMWATKIENENWATKRSRCVAHTDYSEIARKNSKRVIQSDMRGNVIKTWESLAEIYRELGYSKGNISMCCNGKHTNPLYESYWKYEGVV